MQGSANLNLMIKAARKAGRSLVKDFREVENLQVSSKGPGDFVTKADREAERIIKEELMTGRPTYGWLGEETGGTPGQDPTRRWIVDPLDGTTNFANQFPFFCVSIGYGEFQQEGTVKILAGGVGDPIHQKKYLALDGGGATCNGAKMQVQAERPFPQCFLVTGFYYTVGADLDREIVERSKFETH
jgi:myo-inositol-1(or 4)-monophosphatase